MCQFVEGLCFNKVIYFNKVIECLILSIDISERFAKTWPLGARQGLSPGLKPAAALNLVGGGSGEGAELHQGPAGDMVQALAYLLVVCWQPAVNSREEGRVSFTDSSTYLDFNLPNDLDIDCVLGILLSC